MRFYASVHNLPLHPPQPAALDQRIHLVHHEPVEVLGIECFSRLTSWTRRSEEAVSRYA
jgi:hypothetical protein